MKYNEFDEIDRFFAGERYKKDSRRFGSNSLNRINTPSSQFIMGIKDSSFIKFLNKNLVNNNFKLTKMNFKRLIITISHLFPDEEWVKRYKLHGF